MYPLRSRDWWAASGIRALRTMAQTLVALIGTGVVITDVDWAYCLSATVMAGVIAVLMAFTGLPELDSTNTQYLVDSCSGEDAA